MENRLEKWNICKKQTPWQGKWIWAGGDGQETNVYYYFRKVFRLENNGKRHRLVISADTRYQLFINGTFIQRGPPQSQPYYQYYDQHDVDKHLREGSNCIAVIVNHVGNIPDTRGGLLLELLDENGVAVVCTDWTWRVSRAEAWEQNTYKCKTNLTTPYQEFFDARKEPVGWCDIDFDDSAWSCAEVIKGRVSDRPPAAGPWAKLIPRDIPFMTNEPVFPERIEYVEESLDLNNRSRTNDLAPGLSMVGQPITYSRLDDSQHLCNKEGQTIVQSSTQHEEDLDFDGLYAPAVVLDFGRIITARARIHLEGIAGGMVDIGYAERLIDGHFNTAMECEFADRYTMKDGEQVFESFTWKSFRYLKLRFRYCPEPVTVHSILGMISTYPYEYCGNFESGDATLNAVFQISRTTLRLCSNEFLMDTPWREQAQWLGDVALVTLPAVHSCFGDTMLTRKFCMQAGQNQHPTGMIANKSNSIQKGWLGTITDYSLWWIKAVRDQYFYTGEEELLYRLYPQALRVIEAHLDYLNENALIQDMPCWMLIDWAKTEKRGVSSAYNAIFYTALGCLYELAEYREDTQTKELIQELRSSMKASFHDTLYDQNRGCYADANIDGQLSDMISEHGNMTPIYAGLCDETVGREVIKTVFESDNALTFTEAQPFYMGVVLPALDRADRFDLALDLIRRRWGRRMVEKNATSVFEEWYRNGSWRDGYFKGFLRSQSHAWSGFPADFLIRHLIGLEILEPGGKKARVSPYAASFNYQAVFTTPAGHISVECENGNINVDCDKSLDIEVKKR